MCDSFALIHDYTPKEMDAKVTKLLEEAREHFRSRRFLNAYHLMRRYFDRLPFQPEAAHGELIGLFAQTIFQLGKNSELAFYMRELERALEKTGDPHIKYALGYIYCFLPEPRFEAARRLFESLIRETDGDLLIKAKIMLAWYYDTAKSDVGACRIIVDSIAEPADSNLKAIWRTWKAKVLRDEKRFEEAEALYRELLLDFDSDENWFPYCVASMQLGNLYLQRGECARARRMLATIRRKFDTRNFKSLDLQLQEFARKLEEREGHGVIYCEIDRERSVLTYEKRKLVLKRRSPSSRLLQLLAGKQWIDKSHIVRALYDRDYVGESDDKLIYYHIHCLRKRLGELGVPKEAIRMGSGGYRLLPRVESRRGEG